MKYLFSVGIVVVFVALGSAPRKTRLSDAPPTPWNNDCFFTHQSAIPNSPVNQSKEEKSAPTVTPVEGPSWLKHLGVSDLDQTSMGQMGGNEPPPSSRRIEPDLLSERGSSRNSLNAIIDRLLRIFRKNQKASSGLLNKPFVLTGADLYRLNCQSCHGPSGVGAPPEIKSLIGPVQGTSPAMIQERMKRIGHPIDEGMAKSLAASAKAAILSRLQNGGQRMPAFRHLRGDEVEALLMYLKKLSGVPSSETKTMRVTQSVARVGEHVIKGTCHTCHDATGPGGGRMAMMSGVVPSLASFTRDYSVQQVVRQVELGSSGMMSMMGGSTMPAMPFITEQEAVAAYLYLLEYPPRS